MKKGSQDRITDDRLLESIVNFSPNIIYVYNIIEGKIVFCNEHIQDMLGYSSDEILAMSDQVLSKLMHPDDFSFYLSNTYPKYALLKDEELLRHQYRLKDRKGMWRWMVCNEKIFKRNVAAGEPVEILGVLEDINQRKWVNESNQNLQIRNSIVPCELTGEQLFLEGFVDVSRQRRSELALQESEENFRMLFNVNPLPLCHVNTQGEMVLLNDRFTQLFGYTLKDVPTIDDWWQKAYPDESYRNWVLETWGEAVKDAAEKNIDIMSRGYKVTCKNGETKVVAIGGITLNDGLLATFIDVTERYKAENDLRESEQKFRQIFDALNESLFIFNFDGNIVEANKTASTKYGYSKEELLVLNPLNLITSEYHSVFENFVQELKQKGTFAGETIDITKRGRRFHTNVKGSVVVLNGQPHMLASINDISKRIRAEELIRESELRYRTLAESSLDQILIVDKDLYLTYINDVFANDIGIPFENLVGVNLSTLFPLAVVEKQKEAVLNVFRSQTSKRIVSKLPFKNGDKWLNISLVPLKNYQGNVYAVMIVARDVSNEKRVEEHIRIQRDFALELNHCNTINDAFKIAMKAINELIGLDTGALYCLDFTSNNLVLEAKRNLPEDFVQQVRVIEANSERWNIVQKKKPFFININDQEKPVIKHLDEVNITAVAILPLVIKNAVIGCLNLATNHFLEMPENVRESLELFAGQLAVFISDLKNQEMLAESEEKHRAIFQSASDAFIITHLKDMKIVDVNQAACEIYKYHYNEFVGLSLYDIVHPSQRSNLDEFSNQLQLKGNYTGETLDVRKDGSTFETEVRGTIITYHQSPHILSVIRDISEKKKAEAEAIKANMEYQRSNEELEQFAYVSSHDLQEPLRKVKNYAELLEARYKPLLDEKAARYIDIISNGASRMQILIDDLLTISRVTTQGRGFDQVDISQVVDDVIETLELRIKNENVCVRYENLPRLLADERQLNQVFQNLITNAMKFRNEFDPVIEISAEEQENNWLFKVKDNGIGFDNKFAERIFIVFQRLHTREEYSGTGIGLAICKKIIERHGGSIWAKSEQEHGATFYFTIAKN